MVNKVLAAKLAQNQVIRFVFSAGLGFLVDVLAFHLLFNYILTDAVYKVFSFPLDHYTLSLAISFSMGVVTNFLITRYMVFYESKLRPSRQFIRFISVAAIGYFANLELFKLLKNGLYLYPDVARILAAVSLFFASFFIHKVFSFSLSLRHHES